MTERISYEKKLAIIGSDEMAALIADEARKMGIASHSFSYDPNGSVMGHSDQHHIIDIFDLEELLATCRRLNISGVIATSELTISVAAKIADELGLKGMPVNLSEKVTDKGYVREKVSSLTTIKQPFYHVYHLGEKIPTIEKYPLVVKPTAKGGKRGVSLVESEEKLEAAIEYAKMNLSNSESRIILEGYVEGGKEYSVESLSSDGSHKVIQITEKLSSGPPHFVELGHLQPANLSPLMRSKVEKAVVDLLTVVGIDNSPSHTEIKLIGDEIYLIELNSRFGGDHIAYPLTTLSTGYFYIQAAIAVVMGTYEEPDTSQFEKNACGVIFVTQQTAKFKPLFDKCEEYSWLYEKFQASEELQEIIHNRAYEINSMIYRSDQGIPKEIESLL